MAQNTTVASKRTGLPKTTVYEALCALNLHFEDVLSDLDRLRALGVFRDRFQRESVETCRTTIEETRSWINFEATESLHGDEERDRARFGRTRHRFEKEYEDPQDVLLLAKRIRKQAAKSARKRI